MYSLESRRREGLVISEEEARVTVYILEFMLIIGPKSESGTKPTILTRSIAHIAFCTHSDPSSLQAIGHLQKMSTPKSSRLFS